MILLSCSSVTNNVVEIDNIIYHKCDGYYVVDGPKNEDLFDAVILDQLNGKPVKEISNEAFYNCCYLVNVSIPSSFTTIGDFAFMGCSCLNNITIPSSFTTIGEFAFGWTNLEEIIIPSSVKSMGANLFLGCNKLEKIYVDEKNKKYDSRNNCNAIIETETNTLVSSCKNTIIPNTVLEIGDSAFEFSDLKELAIPSDVTSIGERAFTGCDKLERIIVDENNKKYDSRKNCNAIIETETNTLISGCKNTIIPSNVTSISDNAFFGSSDLKVLIIPSSVMSIGRDAFYGCKQLDKVYYLGTINQWNSISIEEENENLIWATRYYYS